MANMEAIRLLAASFHDKLVESDSSNVISWISSFNGDIWGLEASYSSIERQRVVIFYSGGV